jgi:hypothetical protein
VRLPVGDALAVEVCSHIDALEELAEIVVHFTT